MIFDYITEFAGYLNDRGYAVTQNKISRFLSLKMKRQILQEKRRSFH